MKTSDVRKVDDQYNSVHICTKYSKYSRDKRCMTRVVCLEKKYTTYNHTINFYINFQNQLKKVWVKSI